ncbi:TPA: urease subunit beta, partial [Staphylococcus aureus]|nr:urease subunit beta [Staphylococcus aureus]
YRPTDENDEYAGVFGDNGTENVNKKGGKRS